MAVEELFKATGKLQRTTIVKDLHPLRDHVIVTEMSFEGRKLSSGVILLGDDGLTSGIRPRWAKVFRVGPEQTEIKVGQWVLVEHGRWTRGLKVEMNEETFVVRRVDPTSIIGVQDAEPDYDDTISTAVQAQRKTRD